MGNQRLVPSGYPDHHSSLRKAYNGRPMSDVALVTMSRHVVGLAANVVLTPRVEFSRRCNLLLQRRCSTTHWGFRTTQCFVPTSKCGTGIIISKSMFKFIPSFYTPT